MNKKTELRKLILMLVAVIILLPAFETSVLAAPVKNGWVQEEGGYRYYENDVYVTNVVKKLSKLYYGFGADGFMYKDCSFEAESEELKGSALFRAKSNGTLYVNEWYKEGANHYYYGDAGAAVSGVRAIGDKLYCFTEEGKLITGSIYEQDGKYYSIDDNGYATEMKDNSWTIVTSGGSTKNYYVQNGILLKNTVAGIGVYYYGFSEDGEMIGSGSFEIYDPATQRMNHYRVKSVGKLYAAEWVQDGDRWYYYGTDAAAVRGLQIVKGKAYLFDETGLMQTDTYTDGTTGAYYADRQGKVTVVPNDTWTKIENAYFYAIDGKGLRNTVRKIGASFYGFAATGKMYADTAFTAMDEETGSEQVYRAKSSGALYVNTWYGRYHYGAGGKADHGLKVIGGKTYFFDEKGCAVSDQFKEIDGSLYHADKNGVLTKVSNNGFCYEDADHTKLCYFTGGKALMNAWKRSGKYYYYFDDKGYAVTDAVYPVKGKKYLFRPDGTMVDQGWCSYNGAWYYVKKGGALAIGDLLLNGKWYYFGEDGDMRTGLVRTSKGSYLYGSNGVYIGKAKENGWSQLKGNWYYLSGGVLQTGYRTVDQANYFFDARGIMETNKVIDVYGKMKIFGKDGAEVKSGWYQIGGRWYYVDPADGSIVRNKKFKVGKANYYFDEDGKMSFTDKVVDGVLYSFDANGVITSEKKAANGWTLFGGVYLYYKNGIPYTGWVNNYYIQKGIMLRGAETPDGYYVAANGAYQKTAGWVKKGSGATAYESGQYVKKGGRLASDEWLQLGKNWYYFNGRYRCTGVQKIDGKWYIFNDAGVMTKQLGKVLPQGWVEAGSDWYYFKDDILINGSLKIGSKIYSFHESRMKRNGFGPASDQGTAYYCGKDGDVSLNYGWKQIGGRWFCFGQDGRADIRGWIQQKGKSYYIDDNGMCTGYRVLDGKLYYFNKDGALTQTYNFQNGWKKAGGKWYYFKDGEAVTGTVVTDKGKTYLMDWDGTLAANEAVGEWYADSQGVIVRRAWKKVGSVYCYYGAEGTKLAGVWKIGGKVYYLDD